MNLRVILLFAVSSVFFAIQVFSTPYWDEHDFERFQAQRFFPYEVHETPEGPSLSYSYPYQLAEIARFLSVWQVSDSASPDYGGMREGEHPEVQNIIETDNTQESIWIWCRYAQLTGDTTTYRPNTDAAWTYVSRYPAYNEEGTQSPYYRIHNCGWALVAYQIYEEVYGDTSRVIYADSCADYIVTRKDSLPFDDFNFYGRLHPLVAGWGAGTLYEYGLSGGRQDYVDTALVLGARVADWVDSNSAKRLSDEVWAMSSGTAMWGVVNSVVVDDPPGWSAWLTDFAESLQVYEEASSWNDWNNSWNIWYANAFNSIGRALTDSRYADYHRMLTDTLLIQDTDEDGGIPANSMHTDTMDQSWVSCYLGMMGIEGLIDSLPAHDVGPLAFLSPHEAVLIPVGDSVPVAVTAVNYGLSSESGVPIEVAGDFSAATTVDLTVASSDTALFPGFWVPLVDSVYELVAYTSLLLDEDHSNDTLRASIIVLPVVIVSGSVKDSLSGNGIDAWLYFHRMGPPADTLWDSTSTDISGDFSVSLVTGTYDIQISPTIPYPETTVVGIDVVKDSTVTVDVKLTPASLLIMDDDEGKNYESYYTSSLDSIGVNYILWDVSSEGVFPISIMSLFGSPIR
ncbi:carboxypeptidase regulatory-like domain-containing protein [candidate division TA06 bacterium]|uniref:Carboxypeptidase regulatory-like domain-containing protein n=1 Tax=candidate division TA06 bacterium TaxID=2250710 RepID=A0A523UW02_UNCT6|nr:MAG: carboxypeptidase regulatory-like domain-containing protein [candidate division TA06 bacterium]